MSEKLIDKLQKMSKLGKEKHKSIAKTMLDQKYTLKTIKNMSEKFYISLSTAHRFIKSLGYPSFKHFIHEYNNQDNNFPIYDDIFKKVAFAFAQSINNKSLYILSSRRGKSLGKYLNERLNDGKIANHLFHEYGGLEIDEFIAQSKKNVLLIFDVSGNSYIIKKALSFLSKMPPAQKPTVLIVTSGDSFVKNSPYLYFSLSTITKNKYNLDSWNNYNDVIFEIQRFLHFLMTFLYQIKNQQLCYI